MYLKLCDNRSERVTGRRRFQFSLQEVFRLDEPQMPSIDRCVHHDRYTVPAIEDHSPLFHSRETTECALL